MTIPLIRLMTLPRASSKALNHITFKSSEYGAYHISHRSPAPTSVDGSSFRRMLTLTYEKLLVLLCRRFLPRVVS